MLFVINANRKYIADVKPISTSITSNQSMYSYLYNSKCQPLKQKRLDYSNPYIWEHTNGVVVVLVSI